MFLSASPEIPIYRLSPCFTTLDSTPVPILTFNSEVPHLLSNALSIAFPVLHTFATAVGS